MASVTYTIGTYHSLVCPSDDPYSITPNTNILLDNFPLGSGSEPLDHAKVCGEGVSNSRSEVVSCLINLTMIYSGGTVEVIWYDLDGTTELYKTVWNVPDPDDFGYSYWRWYSVASWIGHFPHEIKGPGQYKVQVNTFLGNRTLYYTVYSNKGSISCKSSPSGANILLAKIIPNQQPIYVNQNKITLAFIPVILTGLDPGLYNVRFSKDGYVRCLSAVTVVKEQEVLASCTLTPEVTTGELECVSSPSGARVYLDGSSSSSGTTPLILTKLLPGTHTVIFKLSGYLDCQKQLEVYVGQTRVIACDLEELTGLIHCRAYNSKTQATLSVNLEIDGVSIVPKTPHTTTPLSVGLHTVKFSLDGYKSISLARIVVAGQTVDVTAYMMPLDVPGPGFDITVNIPSIPTLQTLHVVRVIKFPFTTTWVPLVIAPIIGTQIRWDNISNQLYKARQTQSDSSPVPALYSGTPLKEGEHYAIHAGKQLSPFYDNEIVHTVTSGKTSVTISKLADVPSWLITLCGFFDVSPANCIVSFYNVVPDIAYSAEDISIIKDGKSIYPPYEQKTPTYWNYFFAALPIIPIGKLGKISKPLAKFVKEAKLELANKITQAEFLLGISESMIIKYLCRMPESQVDEITTLMTQEEWTNLRTLLAKNGRYATAYEFMKYAVEVDPDVFKKGYVNALMHTTWGEHTDIGSIVKHIELMTPADATLRRNWWHSFLDSLEEVVGGTKAQQIIDELGIDVIIERANKNDRIWKLGLKEYRDIVSKLEDAGVPKGTVDDMMKVTDPASAKTFFQKLLADTLAYSKKYPGRTVVGIIAAIGGLIGTSEFIIWRFKEMLIDPPNFNLVRAVQLADKSIALEHLAHFKYMIEVSEPLFRLLSYGSPFAVTTIPMYIDNMKKTHDLYADILNVSEQKFYHNEFLLSESISGEVIKIIDGDTIRCNFKLIGLPEKGATSAETSTVYKHNGNVLENGGTFIPGDLEHDVRFLGINTPEGHLYDYSCTNVREPYLVRRLETPGTECISEDIWHVDSAFYNSTKVWIGAKLPLHQMATFKSDTTRQFDDHGRLLAVPWVGNQDICWKSLAEGQSVVFFYDKNKQVIVSQYLAAESIARNSKTGVWTFSTGTGTIRCTSYPTACEVWLDGTYTGKKTSSNVAYLMSIVAGPHKITFKKIIDNIPRECSIDIVVLKEQTVNATCTLPTNGTPTPWPTPTPTPTPPPDQIGTWNIEEAKTAEGAILSAAKVHIDDVYLHHYAPEKLIFCDECSCDNLVPCGFGSHTLTIKRNGYQDWNMTRTISPGTNIFEFPVMIPIGITPTPSPTPSPTYSISIKSVPPGAIVTIL